MEFNPIDPLLRLDADLESPANPCSTRIYAFLLGVGSPCALGYCYRHSSRHAV
ncbi:hypothetical protein PSEUDO8AS_100272 [Pseudomonas sp. 8AS]|uniref:hypothetical protein n=1 Tax=Pseudomonas sp. 8AS TaxID=2653163 RepID=UPI0012F360DB|nr:hypothetical protein [Pseudomonas sp. 8AS]VXB44584.1 hypothetical protein PSEUDO8AS_100272 [Pseudomonas sp. 8AS]